MPEPIRVGLIGRDIAASRSPDMHMAEAKALGLDLTYELLDDATRTPAPGLAALLDEAERRGFAGVNVTHPFKQAVLPLLHAVSRDAERLGAVNTVRIESGRRVGHNTDWSGFAESLRRGLPNARRGRVLLLGAGGAGAAVAYALAKGGAGRIVVSDPDTGRAHALATRLNGVFGRNLLQISQNLTDNLTQADGVVQATPLGMAGNPGLPLPPDLLKSHQWVAEVVYFPLETEFLRRARGLGCQTLDGGGMAVFQAAAALDLFTGVAPDRERMLKRFRETTP